MAFTLVSEALIGVAPRPETPKISRATILGAVGCTLAEVERAVIAPHDEGARHLLYSEAVGCAVDGLITFDPDNRIAPFRADLDVFGDLRPVDPA